MIISQTRLSIIPWLAPLAVVGLSTAASGQPAFYVGIGETVRISVPNGEMKGEVTRATGDSVFLALPDSPEARSVGVAILPSTLVEVLTPRSRIETAVKGAGIGLLATGVTAAALSLGRCVDCTVPPGLIAALVLAPPFVAAGALIGLMVPFKKWRQVHPIGALDLAVGVGGPGTPTVSFRLGL